jgi:hypothetical protein
MKKLILFIILFFSFSTNAEWMFLIETGDCHYFPYNFKQLKDGIKHPNGGGYKQCKHKYFQKLNVWALYCDTPALFIVMGKNYGECFLSMSKWENALIINKWMRGN